jgi:myo-inositol-1(or 4)-monophosphatase
VADGAEGDFAPGPGRARDASNHPTSVSNPIQAIAIQAALPTALADSTALGYEASAVVHTVKPTMKTRNTVRSTASALYMARIVPTAYVARGNRMSEAKELEGVCAEAARRGGAVLREAFGRRRTISYKGGIDLVTDADHASEAALLEFLAARCPGAAVLAEESGASGIAGGRLRFIVDPLDGTTNYAHGLPHFAVNVGVEDEQGLLAGATYDPLRDEMFLAARGQGASLGGAPIATSDGAELGRALLCTGFPYDVHQNPDGPLGLFAAYLKRARAIRRMGSAALDLAYVACGRFDGFWEMKLKPWDLAPGILLVREAGGIVTDFGRGDGMLASGEICAANRPLHPALMAVLAEVRATLGAR